MTEYIIYRHGFDGENQTPDKGLPAKMPVLRLRAESPEEACRLAAEQVPLSANQRFSAELAEVADAREEMRSLRTEAVEVEGMDR